MLKGVKWFVTLDNGIVQMIDFWIYLHEFSDDYFSDDYKSWIYDKPYIKGDQNGDT